MYLYIFPHTYPEVAVLFPNAKDISPSMKKLPICALLDVSFSINHSWAHIIGWKL